MVRKGRILIGGIVVLALVLGVAAVSSGAVLPKGLRAEAAALPAPATGALPPQVDPSSVPYGYLVSGSHIADTEAGAFARVLSLRGGTDVFTRHIQFKPGDSTGWHTHAGPIIVEIVRGTLTLYESNGNDCPAVTYGPGQSFVDSGFGHVHLARNEGTENSDFYAVYLTPAGTTTVAVPADRPSSCPASVK